MILLTLIFDLLEDGNMISAMWWNMVVWTTDGRVKEKSSCNQCDPTHLLGEQKESDIFLFSIQASHLSSCSIRARLCHLPVAHNNQVNLLSLKMEDYFQVSLRESWRICWARLRTLFTSPSLLSPIFGSHIKNRSSIWSEAACFELLYAKNFTYHILVNPHKSPQRNALFLSPIHLWQNWGSEKLRNWRKLCS